MPKSTVPIPIPKPTKQDWQELERQELERLLADVIGRMSGDPEDVKQLLRRLLRSLLLVEAGSYVERYQEVARRFGVDARAKRGRPVLDNPIETWNYLNAVDDLKNKKEARTTKDALGRIKRKELGIPADSPRHKTEIDLWVKKMQNRR